jgi:hypothetical protein
MTLSDLAGSDWLGTAELWLDPLGNSAQTSACTLHVETNGLQYTWHHEGTPHRGAIALDDVGGTFTDSWHSPTPMRCSATARPSALIDLLGSYSGGDGPLWGWRLLVSLRPADAGTPESLVLQMTNIAPWGEEARAVRMVAARRLLGAAH